MAEQDFYRKNYLGMIQREEVITLAWEYALPQVYSAIWDYYRETYIVESCFVDTHPYKLLYGVVNDVGEMILLFESRLIFRCWNSSKVLCPGPCGL